MYCMRRTGILLRDMVESDIADYLRWETEETEWQLWDAPWMYEGRSPEQCERELREYRQALERRVRDAKACTPDDLRPRLEICLDDSVDPAASTHIGGLGSYLIDDEFNVDDASGVHRAIGLDICDMRACGKGHAATAMDLFIEKFRARGLSALYCQTWSGNVRMINLARKLGFRECCRKPGLRRVRGAVYDGLTFELKL